MFWDADTKKDGLVDKASSPKAIDMTTSIPKRYGYASTDSELLKTKTKGQAARQETFYTRNLKSTEVSTQAQHGAHPCQDSHP